MKARWLAHRWIAQRLVITGTLELVTPAHFGNGESDQFLDMPLARDPFSAAPLLTGASVAGALRNYVRDWELGYHTPYQRELTTSLTRQLFGEVVGGESRESYLLVDDALAQAALTELRDGVALEPATHTAATGKLFNIETLAAGTQFNLRFELLLPGPDAPAPTPSAAALQQALAIALSGLQRGEIGLGMRKHRGLGECKVHQWRVETFDLHTPAHRVAWLVGRPGLTQTGGDIVDLFKVRLTPDQRRRFTLEAMLALPGSSVLIRSGAGQPDAPDMTHLTSRRKNEKEPVPILSGTSLAGALRARAEKIARLLGRPEVAAEVFGPRLGEGDADQDREKKRASRAVIRERPITAGLARVQSRVKIDRFTCGTYPGALFDQQPVFGTPQTRLTVSVELRNPTEAQIGLWLLLLKDLWTGDLPVGGEISVGRGRLRGCAAHLAWHTPSHTQTWHIEQQADGQLNLSAEQRAALQAYVDALNGGAA